MKIFFNTDVNDELHDTCVNPCPFHDKENNIHGDRNPMVGSCVCQECKYCYGYYESKDVVIKFAENPTHVYIQPEHWVKCCYPHLIHDEIPTKYQLLIKLYNIKKKLSK